MKTWNVTSHRIPRNFNDPRTHIVEANTGDDAIELVRRSLNDHSDLGNYSYEVVPYEPKPVEGKILSSSA